jgi:hypothetical protein
MRQLKSVKKHGDRTSSPSAASSVIIKVPFSSLANSEKAAAMGAMLLPGG